jgi:hypothetical protein
MRFWVRLQKGSRSPDFHRPLQAIWILPKERYYSHVKPRLRITRFGDHLELKGEEYTSQCLH